MRTYELRKNLSLTVAEKSRQHDNDEAEGRQQGGGVLEVITRS